MTETGSCNVGEIFPPAVGPYINDVHTPHFWGMGVGPILRPKMNCTVRFGKQFSESSPCLPGQQGTGQQGWYASGTLRKQFTKPTVQFILGRSTLIPMCCVTKREDL